MSPMTMRFWLRGIYGAKHEIKGLLKKVVIPNSFQFNGKNYQLTWRAQLQDCKQMYFFNISKETRSIDISITVMSVVYMQPLLKI